MTSLERVCAALRDASVGYAIVGGHAVALHGAVRGTVDIDLVLRWTEETLVRAEAALKDIGLVPQLPIRAKDVPRRMELLQSGRSGGAGRHHHHA